MSKKEKKVLIIVSGIVVSVVGIIIKFWNRFVRLFKNIRYK